MKEDQASITAVRNAFTRAVESDRSEAIRIVDDPYAKFFLDGELEKIYTSPARSQKLLADWDRVVPGVRGSVLARTRYIDDCLLSAVNEGIEQLVILGAGYDTRPYRFIQQLTRVKVFEVDYPATLDIKQARLENMVDFEHTEVQYIPIDFQKQKIAPVLFENGYSPQSKSFFIWEGVTYYLTAEAVEETLAFIATSAGPGSQLVFDFFPPNVANGTCDLPEAVAIRSVMADWGEAITFGLDPESVGEFLTRRGFHQIVVANHRDCRALYLNERSDLNLSSMFYFAYAETVV